MIKSKQMAGTTKYKCSKCETIGEAVSETCCPVCGAEMLQLKEGQDSKQKPKKLIICLKQRS